MSKISTCCALITFKIMSKGGITARKARHRLSVMSYMLVLHMQHYRRSLPCLSGCTTGPAGRSGRILHNMLGASGMQVDVFKGCGCCRQLLEAARDISAASCSPRQCDRGIVAQTGHNQQVENARRVHLTGSCTQPEPCPRPQRTGHAPLPAQGPPAGCLPESWSALACTNTCALARSVDKTTQIQRLKFRVGP